MSDDGSQYRHGNGQSQADPTPITRDVINHEISMLRELVDQRFHASQQAIQLLQNRADKSPSIDVVAQSVGTLDLVTSEKFRSISIQFIERDTRTEQTSRDSKVAVDAALQAAKEAVGEQNKSSALAIAKSEAATSKQIDQIGALIATLQNGMNDKIADLKDRLTTTDLRLTANDGRSKGLGDGWGYLVAVGGLVIGAAALVINLGPT